MLLEHFQSYRDQRPVHATETLYHKEIGFPDDLDMPKGFQPVVNLRYSSHATEEALADKYGEIKLPHRVDIRKGDIFEIGVRGKTVTKLAVRFSYDATRDIILIINAADGFVRTVWFNLKTDKHRTLDRSKYGDPKAARPTR